MECIGVVIHPCLCENPIPDIFWMYPQCSICGRMQRIIAAVFCKNCKGRISPDEVSDKVKNQEIRCKHTVDEIFGLRQSDKKFLKRR